MAEFSDQEIVDYVQHASAALEKAGSIEAAEAARHRKVASALPPAADAVIASGLVGEHERAQLESRLGDHAFALSLLKRASAQLQAAKAALAEQPRALGAPAGQGRRALKAASASPAVTPYFGGQRSSLPRESDNLWVAGLGFAAR